MISLKKHKIFVQSHNWWYAVSITIIMTLYLTDVYDFHIFFASMTNYRPPAFRQEIMFSPASVCLSVCLSICYQNILRTDNHISIFFNRKCPLYKGKNWLNFGPDLIKKLADWLQRLYKSLFWAITSDWIQI